MSRPATVVFLAFLIVVGCRHSNAQSLPERAEAPAVDGVASRVVVPVATSVTLRDAAAPLQLLRNFRQAGLRSRRVAPKSELNLMGSSATLLLSEGRYQAKSIPSEAPWLVLQLWSSGLYFNRRR